MIERRHTSDGKHIGVLSADKKNITTPLDKMNNIKIKRRDTQSKALSELGGIWQNLERIKPEKNQVRSLQRRVHRESMKCARTFGRMNILVGRTQTLIEDEKEAIHKHMEEKRMQREQDDLIKSMKK